MIKVSLVVPVYNVEKYLRSCLDSLVEQTLKDIEIICVNDGSTDKSQLILEEYAACDSRIIIINKTNGGQSSARNLGVGLVKGEYLLFMDSDDILERDALRRLYQRATQDELDILFYDCDCFADEPAAETQTKNYQQYYHRSKSYPEVKSGVATIADMIRNSDYLCSPCLELWRTEFIRKNRLEFIVGILHEDVEFTFHASLLAQRAAHLGETLFHRRVRGSGSTMTSGIKFANAYGAFRAFLGMEQAYLGRQERGCSDEWLMKEMSAVMSVARQRYGKLGIAERSKLSTVADAHLRHLFKTLVADAVDGDGLPTLCVNPCVVRPASGAVKVSVIVPVYNMGKFVAECLDSILGQSLKEIEVVCVDDGSTDDSPAILAEYASHDTRVKLISQANLGVFAARNNALDVATGEFVIFMDPDDWYATPKALEWLYMEAVANKVDICGGELVEMLDKNTPRSLPDGYKPSYLYRRSGFFEFADYQYFGWYTRFVFRRSLLEENGIRFPPYSRYQDPPFLVRAMIAAGRFYAFKRTVYACRVEHKTINWKANGCRKLIDVLAGNADIFQLAKVEGLRRLFDRQKENLISTGIMDHVIDNIAVAGVKEALGKMLDSMGGAASADVLACLASRIAARCTNDSYASASDAKDVARSSDMSVIERVFKCYHDEGLTYTLKRMLALGRK